MVSIAKIEMDRQTWHVYRRGVGGPLALSIQAWGQSSMDIEVTPTLLGVIAGALQSAVRRVQNGDT